MCVHVLCLCIMKVSSNSLLSLLKTTSDYSIIQQSVEELLYNVMQFPE